MTALAPVIPEDIDRIATDIVRTQFGADGDPEWEMYVTIARAILAERERCQCAFEKALSVISLSGGRAWDTDIKSAPHGRYVVKQRKQGVDTRVFVPERVILATKCGKVTVSHYIPDEKRWMMLAKGEQPVAWPRWPEHPHIVSPSQAAVVTDENLRKPMAAASGQIIREDGDAPQEASDGGNLSDTEFTHRNNAGAA